MGGRGICRWVLKVLVVALVIDGPGWFVVWSIGIGPFFLSSFCCFTVHQVGLLPSRSRSCDELLSRFTYWRAVLRALSSHKCPGILNCQNLNNSRYKSSNEQAIYVFFRLIGGTSLLQDSDWLYWWSRWSRLYSGTAGAGAGAGASAGAIICNLIGW